MESLWSVGRPLIKLSSISIVRTGAHPLTGGCVVRAGATGADAGRVHTRAL